MLEQPLATPLLQGGTYAGLSPWACSVLAGGRREPPSRNQQHGFEQQPVQLHRCHQRLVSGRGTAASPAAGLEPCCLPPTVASVLAP